MQHVRMNSIGRVSGAAVFLVVLVGITALWMLFAVSVSPFHEVLGTLSIDLLESDDAFCINDAGHWVQLLPAAAGLATAVAAGRAFWRLGAGARPAHAVAPTLLFVALLVAWVAVYVFVGDCGFGSDDG